MCNLGNPYSIWYEKKKEGELFKAKRGEVGGGKKKQISAEDTNKYMPGERRIIAGKDLKLSSNISLITWLSFTEDIKISVIKQHKKAHNYLFNI